MSEVIAWSLIPVWMLLAAVGTMLVLLQWPRLYGHLSTGFTALKQKCTCTCSCKVWPAPSPDDDPTYRPANDIIVQAEPVTNHNYDYSEIDMGKTQTLQPCTQQQKPRMRYEEYQINERNSHAYSYCGDELPEETAETHRNSGPHHYAILEPGSNKRLPVRIVTDDVEDDPNHLYFKLEPGTNKVIPQFNVNLTDIKEKKADKFFVLRPSTETPTDEDDNAYAVNELTDQHHFILQKMYDTL